ncbi:MAG: TlpA disulfide reductase family protein [Acidobacteriota bacterium]
MKILKLEINEPKYFVVLTLLVLAFTQVAAQNEKQKKADISAPVEKVITLEKRTLPSTGGLTGISNIFFSKPKISGKISYGFSKKLKDVEYATIVDNNPRNPLMVDSKPRNFFSDLVPIGIIRYKNSAGETEYVVDTDADFDFTREKKLTFQTFGDMRIADVKIRVRVNVPFRPDFKPIGDYQIILSKDGYVYARISEYRQGNIKIGQNSYKIIIRPSSRNNPSFDLSSNTICLLDFNQDGEFTERWQLDSKGEIIANEEIKISNPFMIDGERFRIAELDEAGTKLKIVSSNEETSISNGFKAPDFSLKGIDNSSFDLRSLKGKIVLLEFWSITCPFCQRILPEVNSLIKKNKNEDFVAIAVARENDIAEVNKYLAQNPREAKVALSNEEIWQTYNRPTITPTYYLLDKKGVIRLSGYGAYTDLIKIIDKKIEEIRSQNERVIK